MKPVFCIGAAIVDDSFYCLQEPLRGTSNPAKHFRSAGGVARNIAHNLAQLGNPVELISHFGLDSDGVWLKDVSSSVGVGLSHSLCTETGTGHFCGILSPSGELYAGAADARLEEEITISFLSQQSTALASASLLVCDCNVSSISLTWLLDFCKTHAVPCVIEPVSVAKASRLAGANLDTVLLITPNDAELAALCRHPVDTERQYLISDLLGRGVQNIWIRRGKKGSEFFSREGMLTIPAPRTDVIDTTGAGDAALAGWIHAWLRGNNPQACIQYGHAMAEIILRTRGAQAGDLDANLLESTVANGRP